MFSRINYYLFLGFAYDVVHYYSSCEGDGPLFKPIDDSQLYNSLMNATYIEMITDYPFLNAGCRNGVSTVQMYEVKSCLLM